MVMATRTAPTLKRIPSCNFSLRSSRRCRSIGKGRIIRAMFRMMLQTAIKIKFPTARLHAASVNPLAEIQRVANLRVLLLSSRLSVHILSKVSYALESCLRATYNDSGRHSARIVIKTATKVTTMNHQSASATDLPQRNTSMKRE